MMGGREQQPKGGLLVELLGLHLPLQQLQRQLQGPIITEWYAPPPRALVAEAEAAAVAGAGVTVAAAAAPPMAQQRQQGQEEGTTSGEKWEPFGPALLAAAKNAGCSPALLELMKGSMETCGQPCIKAEKLRHVIVVMERTVSEVVASHNKSKGTTLNVSQMPCQDPHIFKPPLQLRPPPWQL